MALAEDFPIEAEDILINRPRATEILQQAGLEALVVSHPLSVYYATNKRPVLDRMSTTHQSLAVIPRDASRPIVCIGSGFEYYYNASDTGLAPGVLPFLTVPAAADPLNLGASAMMRNLDKAPLDNRELRRRRLTQEARFFPSQLAALAEALRSLELTNAAIGYDTLSAQSALTGAATQTHLRPAEDLIRHIRLVKTAAEMRLMRAAAHANAEADSRRPALHAAQGPSRGCARCSSPRHRAVATRRCSCWSMASWTRPTMKGSRKFAVF